MRPITAAERTLLAGNFTPHLIVEEKNSEGVWTDLTTLGTADFVDGIAWQGDIDSPVQSSTIYLRREASVGSIAPLMEGSTLNRTSGGVYAPVLDKGREVRAKLAITAIGAPPVTADWRSIFWGITDDVAWPSKDGSITLEARDLGVRLQDTMIEEERVYSTPAGVHVLTIMQEIVNDWLPVGQRPTIIMRGDPLWMIKEYKQDQVSVMDAIRALAMQIGWDVRYLWTGPHTFELTFYQPDRAKTVPDAVLTADEYYEIKELRISSAFIRNVIKGIYLSSASGRPETIVVEDAASISALNGQRKFMQITEDATSNIDTAAEMTAMLEAARSDLALPKVDHAISSSIFWPAELGDLYEYAPNGDHYDTAQKLAVIEFRHEIRNGRGDSELKSRGKPAGAYRDWLLAGGVAAPVDHSSYNGLRNLREIARTATEVTYAWEPESVPLEFWLWEVTKAQPVTSDPWLDLGAPSRYTPDTVQAVISLPRTGFIKYVRLVPVFEEGRLGRAWDFTVQPNDGIPAITEPRQTIAPAGLTTDLTFSITDPAGLGGTLEVWTNHDGADDADPTGAAEGTRTIVSTPATLNQLSSFALAVGGSAFLLDDIKVHAGKGKRVFARFTNAAGVASDVMPILLKPGKPPVDDVGELTPGIIHDFTPFASTIRPVQLAASLPPTGDFVGHLFLNTTDKKLYRWTGTEWTAAVATVDLVGTVSTAQIADAAITASKIGALAVEAGKIAAGAVTEEKIAALAVTVGKIADDAVTAAKIGALAVTEAKVAAGAITEAKLGANAVTTAKLALLAVTDAILAAGAVTTTKITDDAVTTAKIVAGAIVTSKIAAGAVTANEIAANTITAAKIAAGTITGTEIAAATITGAKLVANTITAAQIAAGTITATEIAAATITGAKIAAGTITAGNIAALTITAAEIAAATITGAKIAAGTITAGNIAAGTITANEIAAAAITTAKLDALAVTTDKIAANAITAAKIAANTITAAQIAANTITSAEIAADTITAGQIAAGAISTSELAAGAVTASKISVGTLSAITADLGEITSGHLRNSANTAAIRLSGTVALPSTNYIDFTATGTAPFLKHPGAELLANGNATFTAVKILGSGASPSIATGLDTSRLGTGYSLTVEGKDTAGTIVLTTGTGISANVSMGVSMFVVTFGTAYAANPHGVVSSRNRFAADLAAAAGGAYFIDPITTDFSLICSKTIMFTDSTTYKWSYVVIG